MGNIVSHAEEPLAFSSTEAVNSPFYSKTIDSFGNEPCHLLYIPVHIQNSGMHSIIKVCRGSSTDHSASPSFSDREVMLARFVGRQAAISFENARIAMGSFALSNIAAELEGSIHIKKQ